MLERYIASETDQLVPVVRSSIKEGEGALSEARALEELAGGHEEEELATLGQIVAGLAAFSETSEEVIVRRQSGNLEGARAAREAAAPQIEQFLMQFDGAVERERQEVAALERRADRTGDLAFWLLVISGAVGTALGLATSALIAHSILKPLSSVESVALAVTDGDLEARAQPTGLRELARLGASLNHMTESLLDVDRTLEENVRELATEVAARKRAEEALQRARKTLEGKVEREMLRDNPYGLTFRELTVLHLVAAGRTDTEIASDLVISPPTARKHVQNILGKMNAASRTEASVRAFREGWLD